MEELDTVLELHKAKKIDWLLRLRIVMLVVAAGLFAFAALFDVFEYHVNPWPVVYFSFGGFVAGAAWFYKMIPVQWDEQKQLMRIKRFDFASIVLIGIYFLSRLLLKEIIEAEGVSVIGVSVAMYSTIFGIMVGRTLGLFRVIHNLHLYGKDR